MFKPRLAGDEENNHMKDQEEIITQSNCRVLG
jgi:hypothetical protein